MGQSCGDWVRLDFGRVHFALLAYPTCRTDVGIDDYLCRANLRDLAGGRVLVREALVRARGGYGDHLLGSLVH